jgi:hypothetical protein
MFGGFDYYYAVSGQGARAEKPVDITVFYKPSFDISYQYDKKAPGKAKTTPADSP